VGELINLRKIRKRRSKAEAESLSRANRLAFGARKDERRRRQMERAAAERALNAHRLEGPPGDDD
jgi:Domain of unknown function (DUF4169)